MKIKVTSISFSKNRALRNELLQSFPETTFNDDGKRFAQAELIDYLSDADGAIIGLDAMNREVLHALPDLKILAKFGVGLDNIDLECAQLLGKKIGWQGGVNKRSVAEQTLGFMIGLCRNLFVTSFALKQGQWDNRGGIQLSEKTVGVVGCGYIGTEVLKLLEPFGCQLLINDVVDKSAVAETYRAEQVSFAELLSQSDLVTLHVPLTEQTHQMIKMPQLKQMKSSAFLINTSRGAVVLQQDLKKALAEKIILGAALDVYEEEPPTDLSFLSLPNLIATPHIGGTSQEGVEAMGRVAIESLQTFFLKNR